jgi:hypothetical protein
LYLSRRKRTLILANWFLLLSNLSRGGSDGRKGDHTLENLLRALLVQEVEGPPFRETVIRIGNEPFLQDVLRMRKKAVTDFTFLDKHFLAVQTETRRRINELLGKYGIAREMVHRQAIRTHTTIVESDIHDAPVALEPTREADSDVSE